MRRLIAFILVLVTVLSFAACSSTEQSNSTLSDAYLKVAQEVIEQGDYTSAPVIEASATPEDTTTQTLNETESVISDDSENPFGVAGLIKLDLSSVEWVNYGIQEYGTEPTYQPGLRVSSNMIFDVPYEEVTLYIKINSPYELGIRSGKTAEKMTTNHYWLNNRLLASGDKNKGSIYTLPGGHQKFIISVANISRDDKGEVSSSKNPISLDEIELAGLEIWYAKSSAEPTTAPESTSTETEPVISNYPIQVDVNDMLSVNLLGATFYSAYEDGWLGEWMFLYVHGSSDPPVKYNALWFDEELGQLTYYGILYQQAVDSGWGDIWLDMTRAEKVSTEAIISNADTPDAFIGIWREHTIDTKGYGLALTIEQYDEESLLVIVNHTSDPLGSRVVLFESIVPYDLFFDDAVDFSFDEDGWGNAGKIQLQKTDNEMLCIVYDVNYIGEGDCAMWGIMSGEYLLTKID